LLIYPMAIMLVVLQLVRNKLSSIRLSYYTTIFVTVCYMLLGGSSCFSVGGGVREGAATPG